MRIEQPLSTYTLVHCSKHLCRRTDVQASLGYSHHWRSSHPHILGFASVGDIAVEGCQNNPMYCMAYRPVAILANQASVKTAAA